MQIFGFRVGVISLIAISVFSHTGKAAFSFRDQTNNDRSTRSRLCRRLLLGGAMALGIGYFWFSRGTDNSDPAPSTEGDQVLVIEENPSHPIAIGWREDSKAWRAQLDSGVGIEMKIVSSNGDPVHLRFFDKNRVQRNLAELARAKNAVERPHISLGKGPGFQVLLENVILKLNGQNEIEIEITSQLGSLTGAHTIPKDALLNGSAITLKLKELNLDGEKNGTAKVEGSLQLILHAKKDYLLVDATFRVSVESPTFRVKEHDDSKVTAAMAVLAKAKKAE